MIIPLIFTLDPVYENLSQTWVFYKAVSFCKKYGWPVIAQQQYFTEWEKQNRIFPQFFQQDLCNMFEYDVPKKADLLKIQQISIPQKIEQDFINQNRTQSDAYIASFREDWKEIEDFLCDALKKIIEESKEKIEAITSLTYIKFLDNVSKRMNIPVVYYEWGPFRYSSYRNTAFFDVDGEYKQVRSMFETFKRQGGFENLPVLNANEILALLLKDNYLRYVTENVETSPNYNEYEMGIIGGYNSLVETSAYTYLNMVELYNNALKTFSTSEVAVRYHPGDPIHAHLNAPNEKTGELIDFILSCKRVACISSNVEVEAMLYGKKVYDTGVFKYQGIVNGDMLQLEDREPTIEEINFIIFVSIIPFEFLNSVEYMRFRLSKPDLREIYIYHLKYYLECFQISYEKFCEEKEKQLMLILQARKDIGDLQTFSNFEMSEKISELKMYVLLQQYKNSVDRLQAELVEKQKAKEELAMQLKQDQDALNLALQTHQNEKENLRQQLEDVERVFKENTERLSRELEQAQLESEQRRLENEQYYAENQKYCVDNEQLRRDNERLLAQYNLVMNSKSMKLTKPLRMIFGRRSTNGE